LGSYILNITEGKHKYLDPFRSFFKNKGIIYMLVAALLASLSAPFIKIVINNSDVFFGTSINLLLLCLSFTIIAIVRNKRIFLITYKNNSHKFIVMGLILAFVAITMNIAFTMQIVPYVISVKRLSILFGVIFGGFLFKEKNLSKRIVGSIVMILGTILIIY